MPPGRGDLAVVAREPRAVLVDLPPGFLRRRTAVEGPAPDEVLGIQRAAEALLAQVHRLAHVFDRGLVEQRRRHVARPKAALVSVADEDADDLMRGPPGHILVAYERPGDVRCLRPKFPGAAAHQLRI